MPGTSPIGHAAAASCLGRGMAGCMFSATETTLERAVVWASDANGAAVSAKPSPAAIKVLLILACGTALPFRCDGLTDMHRYSAVIPAARQAVQGDKRRAAKAGFRCHLQRPKAKVMDGPPLGQSDMREQARVARQFP
jgi:hypothetical protein